MPQLLGLRLEIILKAGVALDFAWHPFNHTNAATLERSVRARGTRVYIDCLQNILGKTLASAYSARASEHAGVSTPVTWTEIDEGFDRRAFTIQTVPGRVKQVGDLWGALRGGKGVDLARVTRDAQPSQG